jgi:hypothetical protein
MYSITEVLNSLHEQVNELEKMKVKGCYQGETWGMVPYAGADLYNLTRIKIID